MIYLTIIKTTLTDEGKTVLKSVTISFTADHATTGKLLPLSFVLHHMYNLLYTHDKLT